jgi:2'-5' RNA ligase
MPAITAVVRKGGGSLKKSKQQVKAELEHKDEMKAASTMRKVQLSLKAKGFTPALDKDKKPIEGVFVNKDGRKATLRMVGKRLSLAITKKPVKKVEEELKDAEGYKYSSVQVNIPPSIASRMLAFAEAIPDSELAGDGRESIPHVTVLYGLHTQRAVDIYEVIDDIPGPVRVTLGDLDYFEGDDYDVIVVRVFSPDLVVLNNHLRGLPYTNGYPDYVPHATLAYVQPGVGARYFGMKTFEGLGFETTSLVFSPKEGDDIVVDLGLRAAMASLIDSDSETLQVLNDAIAARNFEVVHELLGLRDE